MLLLVARKRKTPSVANYVISIDPSDLDKDAVSIVGNLYSNVLGTKFKLYGGGTREPCKRKTLLGTIVYVSQRFI